MPVTLVERIAYRLGYSCAYGWRRVWQAFWDAFKGPLAEDGGWRDRGTIYDIGLHDGADTLFYLKKGFRVVAVDANPMMTEWAKRQFSVEIESGQLVVENVGISESSTFEMLSFFINERDTGLSSFTECLARRDEDPISVVEVPCVSLADLTRRHGASFFVKIDIEGHDSVALRSLLDAGVRPDYLSVESGNCGMLAMLVDSGYTGFKYVNQRDVHLSTLPRPSQHGRYVYHAFRKGSSGPFGEEAPGQWKSADQIKVDIGRVWPLDGPGKNPDHDDRKHGWFDLHAKLGKIDEQEVTQP